MVNQFIAGLELNRRFYHEVVQPLMAAQFPLVAYSAGLVGYGSDVLGYDTTTSTDHEWGPRLLVFLSDEDYPAYAEALSDMLRRELPPSFCGYSTSFSEPNPPGDGVRLRETGKPGEINHHITVMTIRDFLGWELGVSSEAPLCTRDWLTFPEQKLLEVTAGAIYHDGLARLVPLRRLLAYHPHDVWLYRLAAQWQRISQEEAFVGRCADVGDDLGSRLIAARLVRDLMRLCFLLERRYAPYSKWLGTAFYRLECAGRVSAQLSAVMSARDYPAREASLTAAYTAVAEMQSALAVAAPQDATPTRFHERPYRVIHAERFALALTAPIRDEEIRQIIAAVGLVGAVDQFADSADMLSHAGRSRALGRFYDADG